jgi:riboflavin kinase
MNAGAVTLEGRLCSGLGEGAGFTALDWVEHQFHAKLGFRPYPGTLNLNLAGERLGQRHALRCRLPRALPSSRRPASAPRSALPYDRRPRIEGAAVLPDVADYPADKLEIVAPVAVRQELHLNDGDRVTLQLQIE